jgi:hypothetical protein
MMPLLVLLACTAPESDGERAADLPDAYLYEDTGSGSPDYTTDTVAAAVQGVWDRLQTLNASVLFDAYDEVAAFGDGACPTLSYPAGGVTSWETTCSASTGADFAGFWYEYEATETVDVHRFRAEATVDGPGGEQLTLAGDAGTEADAANQRWESSVDGVMSYDGPAAAGTWLAEGLELSLEYEAHGPSVNGVPRMLVDGALSGLPGDVTAMSFTDLAFVPGTSSTCALEPSGSMSIRDAQGVWADLVFDLEAADDGTYRVDDAALCDGCGTLWYGGEDLGQVCLDVTGVVNAPVPPW